MLLRLQLKLRPLSKSANQPIQPLLIFQEPRATFLCDFSPWPCSLCVDFVQFLKSQHFQRLFRLEEVLIALVDRLASRAATQFC